MKQNQSKIIPVSFEFKVVSGKKFTLDGREVNSPANRYMKHVRSIDELSSEEREDILIQYHEMKNKVRKIQELI